jgi:hypothetical protein
MEMDASLDPAAMRARALVRPAAPSAQLHRRTRPPCMHPGGQARSSRSSLGLAAASQQYFSFLSEQTNHQQPVNSIFLSEQISTNHQAPAKRTGCISLGVRGYFFFCGGKMKSLAETTTYRPCDYWTLLAAWFH